ncbi:isoaspartyl peptidase/L-asparaginase [Aspergillus affinis]|uniref:isoaspartyl peptidase/L-asparaginase n=1 Tax=Aspergillus affinis TaxID=1070780 RepID=UPI0022FEBF90|nr:putative asparaginase [Aspergillus affinis]KAI9046294.1 putative asparaginase [Aspergillus affinis]
MKYKPTLIIHGGAGALSRSSIPPHLYGQYHTSLLTYLRSTRDLLNSGSSALDAAVHAVSLLEDDELFNCARGSVFTSAGTIEMEASVMVTSMDSPGPGSTKRGVGVIGLRNVRHPIQLAREVLLRDGLGEDDDGGSMHAQLSAPYVEDLAKQWGLEFQPDEYFWTKRRWNEHVRKLRGQGQGRKQTAKQATFVSDSNADDSTCDVAIDSEVEMRSDGKMFDLDLDLNSLPQGTVGCVCLDQYGNLAVATSTGGMTNKLPGRVGDTPTLGAGFWAERWTESSPSPPNILSMEEEEETSMSWTACLPSFLRWSYRPRSFPLEKYTTRQKKYTDTDTDLDPEAQRHRPTARTPSEPDLPSPVYEEIEKQLLIDSPPSSCSTSSVLSLPQPQPPPPPSNSLSRSRSRSRSQTVAVALSGTGNGDSFLRTCAARTACAMARFSPHTMLSEAVRDVAGPGGELQRSAGTKWGSGEGGGGIIGIEVRCVTKEDQGGYRDGEVIGRGTVVFDFNCGGMWRAWIDEDAMGGERENVMVFRESYY